MGDDDGYTEDYLSPPNDINPERLEKGFWNPTQEEWQAFKETKRYKQGDLSVMRGRLDIHRVYDASTALSMLVHGPRQRNETQVFNEEGIVTYPNFRTQHLGSINRIRARQGLAPMTETEYLESYSDVPEIGQPDTKTRSRTFISLVTPPQNTTKSETIHRGHFRHPTWERELISFI